MTRFLIEWAVLLSLAVAAYFYYVRPILKRIPSLSVLWEQEQSFFSALQERFAGIKTFLAGGTFKAAAAVVFLYDDAIPYVTGVDWTPLTSHIPSWAWPLIIFGGLYLIGKFRQFTNDRRKEA